MDLELLMMMMTKTVKTRIMCNFDYFLGVLIYLKHLCDAMAKRHFQMLAFTSGMSFDNLYEKLYLSNKKVFIQHS